MVLEYALGVGDEQNRILELLRKGPATSAELAQALGTSEPPVLNALHVLRTGRAVEFMAGEWSLAHVLDK